MVFAHGEHAHVRLHVRPEAMTTHDSANGPDLEVDRLWSNLVPQACLLIAADVVGLDVGDELLSEHRQDVRECVFSTRWVFGETVGCFNSSQAAAAAFSVCSGCRFFSP